MACWQTGGGSTPGIPTDQLTEGATQLQQVVYQTQLHTFASGRAWYCSLLYLSHSIEQYWAAIPDTDTTKSTEMCLVSYDEDAALSISWPVGGDESSDIDGHR